MNLRSLARPLSRSSEPMNTIDSSLPDGRSFVDEQREQEFRQQEQERWLAEVSRAEIEKGDLDNDLERVDAPSQMVTDLFENERTKPIGEPDENSAGSNRADLDQQHQQQNLQVVNSFPLKP